MPSPLILSAAAAISALSPVTRVEVAMGPETSEALVHVLGGAAARLGTEAPGYKAELRVRGAVCRAEVMRAKRWSPALKDPRNRIVCTYSQATLAKTLELSLADAPIGFHGDFSSIKNFEIARNPDDKVGGRICIELVRAIRDASVRHGEELGVLSAADFQAAAGDQMVMFDILSRPPREPGDVPYVAIATHLHRGPDGKVSAYCSVAGDLIERTRAEFE